MPTNAPKNSKVFLTGATGFLGSHVARVLVQAGVSVVCLKRRASNLSRCRDFSGRVEWVAADAPDWKEQAIASKPASIVHAAWAGVTPGERADRKLQATNVPLFTDLLHIADQMKLQRFIALGSQAEYSPIHGRVDENFPCQPETAYGATKLACLALLEDFARQKQLAYVWLRLFSIYGPGEGAQWFIPGLIQQMKLGQSPQLSGCEQRYDYLHVYDFAAAVLAVLRHPEKSGVFNLSSNASQPLKKVVQLIREYTGGGTEPVFGALPYRPGQSLHLEGDSSKFYQAFGFAPRITLEQGIRDYVLDVTGEKRH